jgi:hypothetical protein
VDVRVSVIGTDPLGGLESLDDWLRVEPSLAGRLRSSRPAPRDGELGAVADALVVAVGAGGTLSVLATSLHAWLSQPRRSDIRIRVQGDNGNVVEIIADLVDPRHVETLLRQVLGFGPSGE